jgi:predicted Rossmann fold flavoprotein
LKTKFDAIIIGGGAAGFMAAIQVAEIAPGASVAILEKSSKLLSKVRISGGGRCNVTNSERDLKQFSRAYPRGEKFMFRLLHQFGPADTVNWFAKRGVKLVAEDDGRMFPSSNSSDEIVQSLLHAAKTAGVEILMNQQVESFKCIDGGGFEVRTKSDTFQTKYLIIASGGNQKSHDYEWLNQHALNIVAPVPSLFTFNMLKHPICSLMGLSSEARVKTEVARTEETGPVLVTHWGLSGPAVLRSSARAARELAVANYSFKVGINWLPELTQDEVYDWLLNQKEHAGNKKVKSKVFDGIPQRLWEYLLTQSGLDGENSWNTCSNKSLRQFAERITSERFDIEGKTTFKEEFVTAGGVSLNEIDAQTCMAKKIPGLYFAGEVLDSDGITGGFNFQQAWSSGWIAGSSVGKALFTSK